MSSRHAPSKIRRTPTSAGLVLLALLGCERGAGEAERPEPIEETPTVGEPWTEPDTGSADTAGATPTGTATTATGATSTTSTGGCAPGGSGAGGTGATAGGSGAPCGSGGPPMGPFNGGSGSPGGPGGVPPADTGLDQCQDAIAAPVESVYQAPLQLESDCPLPPAIGPAAAESCILDLVAGKVHGDATYDVGSVVVGLGDLDGDGFVEWLTNAFDAGHVLYGQFEGIPAGDVPFATTASTLDYTNALGLGIARPLIHDLDGGSPELIAGPSGISAIVYPGGLPIWQPNDLWVARLPLAVGINQLDQIAIATHRMDVATYGYPLGAADVDGDGFDEVLLGTTRMDPVGQTRGLAAIHRPDLAETCVDRTWSVGAWQQSWDLTGADGLLVPDLDADGHSDLLQPLASGRDTATGFHSADGAIAVWSGGYPGSHERGNERALLTGHCDMGAAALSLVADVSGDGADDVLVAASLDRTLPQGLCSPTVVFVLADLAGITGTHRLLDLSAGFVLAPPGRAQSGDLDGDGIGDILVSASDALRVYRGPIIGAHTSADLVIRTGPTGGYTSSSVLLDLDLDGLPEILVPAPQDATGGPGTGAVWVLEGTSVRAALLAVP